MRLITLLVLSIIILASCKKNQDELQTGDNIIGVWSLHSFNEHDEDHTNPNLSADTTLYYTPGIGEMLTFNIDSTYSLQDNVGLSLSHNGQYKTIGNKVYFYPTSRALSNGDTLQYSVVEGTLETKYSHLILPDNITVTFTKTYLKQ